MDNTDNADTNDIEATPLDDLIDDLLERSPRLIQECEQIRQRMRSGHYVSHDQLKGVFAESGEDG